MKRLTLYDDEIEEIKKIASSASHVIEWGAGESTKIFDEMHQIIKVFSIESDLMWINKLKKEKLKKVSFIYKDIGNKGGNWGCPVDNKKRHLWPNYSNCIHELEIKPNLALIDGRFRVSCAANLYLSNTNPDIYLLVHDYFREEYKRIEDIWHMEKKINTLAIFSKRKQNKENVARDMIKQFEYDHS